LQSFFGTVLELDSTGVAVARRRSALADLDTIRV